jgi:small subunit ribosomal protein S4
VYRLGLAKSRRSARQIVGHGHTTVNGKNVDIPSYRVKVGDVVSIKESKKKSKLYENLTETLAKVEAPSWLAVEAKNLAGKVLNAPTAENPNFDATSIIEFYSR